LDSVLGHESVVTVSVAYDSVPYGWAG
jgi:hypothetical protein